jgi:hypothetical protein
VPPTRPELRGSLSGCRGTCSDGDCWSAQNPAKTQVSIRRESIRQSAHLPIVFQILIEGEPRFHRSCATQLAVSAQGSLGRAAEYIGDQHKIPTRDTQDFLQRSIAVGFVDFEGDTDGPLFNGNLFKRETVAKSAKVLSSLSSEEQSRVTEFDEILKGRGCVLASKADAVLGRTLFEKLKAAGVYEINTVSNEYGEHAFVNSPGAFHKFVSPLVDDSFDLAKALVTALTYGMTLRHSATPVDATPISDS